MRVCNMEEQKYLKRCLRAVLPDLGGLIPKIVGALKSGSTIYGLLSTIMSVMGVAGKVGLVLKVIEYLFGGKGKGCDYLVVNRLQYKNVLLNVKNIPLLLTLKKELKKELGMILKWIEMLYWGAVRQGDRLKDWYDSETGVLRTLDIKSLVEKAGPYISIYDHSQKTISNKWFRNIKLEKKYLLDYVKCKKEKGKENCEIAGKPPGVCQEIMVGFDPSKLDKDGNLVREKLFYPGFKYTNFDVINDSRTREIILGKDERYIYPTFENVQIFSEYDDFQRMILAI